MVKERTAILKTVVANLINKEKRRIENELKGIDCTIDSYYVYVAYKEPVDGKKYATIKEPATQEGLDKIIFDFQSFDDNNNVDFFSLGMEYQAKNLLPGARDIVTINRAA